jgi:FkbM family methyltransferase
MKMGSGLETGNVDFPDSILMMLMKWSWPYSHGLIGLPKFVANTLATTANWHDIFLLRLKLKKSVTARFLDGSRIDVTPENYYIYSLIRDSKKSGISLILSDVIELDFSGRKILLERNPSSLANLICTFLDQEYAPVDCRGKAVVDIGASVGDTAIYFSARGASRVYAFEPYPYAYNLARRNVKINGMENIEVINAGIGGKSGSMKVDSSFESTTGSDLRPSESGKEIPIMSLGDIVKEYGISNGVLKADCEGCEYSFILESDEGTLKAFDEIILEYHYGYLDLMKKLESCGFDVRKASQIHYSYNTAASNPHMIVGILHAKRRL